jgi:tyrosyl-tRNA synthetase
MLKYGYMSENITNKQKIEDILTRGVGQFIDPEGTFRKKLETNPEKIIIKFGVDPTRPDIHLGHAVVLWKLRQLQDLGCKVIFLVGDFTSRIGDPTGKSKVRPELDNFEIINNVNTYIKQIPKILKIEPTTEVDKKLGKDKIIRDPNNFIVDSPWFGWMRNNEWFENIIDISTEKASDEGLTFEIIDSKTKQSQKITVPEDSFIGKTVLYENTRMQKVFLNNKEIRSVSFLRVLSILRNITQSQLIERDMFQERIKSGEPLFMHEMLYPVVQGIDSELISEIYGSCDLEVGGTDQIFNMLIGRKVMEMTKMKETQAVLAFKLLEGTDGKEKMSKSLDNYVGITDEPNDMYGKIMSIPDSSIGNYFELCTFTPLSEVEKIRSGVLDGSMHPKDIKMKLAKQIVSIYHEEEQANKAQESWENTFSKKEIPEDVLEIKVKEDLLLVDVLVKNKIVSSKSDFRRLVREGAVTNLDTDEKIKDNNINSQPATYRIGKKRFIKITNK